MAHYCIYKEKDSYIVVNKKHHLRRKLYESHLNAFSSTYIGRSCNIMYPFDVYIMYKLHECDTIVPLLNAMSQVSQAVTVISTLIDVISVLETSWPPTTCKQQYSSLAWQYQCVHINTKKHCSDIQYMKYMFSQQLPTL